MYVARIFLKLFYLLLHFLHSSFQEKKFSDEFIRILCEFSVYFISESFLKSCKKMKKKKNAIIFIQVFTNFALLQVQQYIFLKMHIVNSFETQFYINITTYT